MVYINYRIRFFKLVGLIVNYIERINRRKENTINIVWCSRVRISDSHFAKCEGISSICEAFSQRNNKNAKLSISFLVSWNKIIQEK